MKCDIYKSEKRKVCLFVPVGSEPQALVPKSLLTQLGKLSFWKTIEFDENSLPLIGADPTKEVIENIKKQGYHVQGFDIPATEKEGMTPPQRP